MLWRAQHLLLFFIYYMLCVYTSMQELGISINEKTV